MKNDLKQALIDIVGENNLVLNPDAQHPHLTDQRNYFHGSTPAIVFPQTAQQISQLVALCIDRTLSIVPQGGNTGYGGGATPDNSNKQLLVCLSKMNKILEIDKTNFTMTVEAGTILADIQHAAEQAKMFFPLSLGAQGSCQIGGNISTNAGGLSVLKYGNTRDLILGIEAVLPNGDILNDLNKLRKNNTGYNLTQLFAGAEGSLGIITKAVLKTFPLPEHRCCMVLAFPDIENLYAFYQLSRQQSADCISSFEYISKDCVELVKHGPLELDFFLDQNHDHYALVEFSSSSNYLPLDDMVEQILNEAMEIGCVADGTIAQSEKQRQAMWYYREAIPETERLMGGSIKHDVSIPISNIGDFLDMINPRLNEITRDKRISVYGHIGDGNLHYNLLHLDNHNPDEFKSSYEQILSECIYQLTKELGGSFSAEHGIGQLKLKQLRRYKDSHSLSLMKKIKQSIDQHNVMNPGKLIDLGD